GGTGLRAGERIGRPDHRRTITTLQVLASRPRRDLRLAPARYARQLERGHRESISRVDQAALALAWPRRRESHSYHRRICRWRESPCGDDAARARARVRRRKRTRLVDGRVGVEPPVAFDSTTRCAHSDATKT